MSDIAAAPVAPTAPTQPNGAQTQQQGTQAPEQGQQNSTGPARNERGQFVGQNGTPAPEAPTTTPSAPRLLKFKGPDGTDMEWSEERAAAELSMNLGAKRKFTELDQQRKAFEAQQAKARQETPWAFEEDPAAKARAAYQFLEQHLAMEQMTPEQRQVWQAQQQLEQRAKSVEEREQALQNQQYEAEQAQLLPVFTQTVPKAMEAAGLPKSGLAVEHVVKELKRLEALGMPYTPENIGHAVESAKEELFEVSDALYKDMTPTQLRQRLGQDKTLAIVRDYLAEVQSKKQQQGQQQQPGMPISAQPTQQQPLQYTERDYRLFKESGAQDIQQWLRETRGKK